MWKASLGCSLPKAAVDLIRGDSEKALLRWMCHLLLLLASCVGVSVLGAF
jgi:hypothetical protein